MKKTIFKGVVNGVNYDCVDDYNKAVQAALKECKNVEAHSSTQITDVPEEESCKKQMAYVPKQECKCNGPEVDFNFKGMMKKSADELAETLEQLATNFEQLPDDYKESLLRIIKDTKVIAERQMKVTEKDIDAIDAQSAEIQDQINALEEQCEELEKKADKAEEVYDKLSMVVECFDDIIANNQNVESASPIIGELWKKLFGMPSPSID